MTVRDARLIIADLAFAAPLVTAAGTIDTRRVTLLRVEGHEGVVGWGEASPLPGWPGPGFDDVHKSLEQWIESGFAQVPPYGPARAAIEGALLDIAAQRNGMSVARKLHADAVDTVAVNGLVDATDPEQVEADTARAVAEGFQTIKLKVATTSQDVERVAAVRASAPDARIRLDANRGLSHDDAIAFCEAVEPYEIEFIEEPIPGGVPALETLQDRVGIAIAADESLAELSIAECADISLGTLVLKPSALGNFESLLRLARSHRLVVTSFLDSAIGLTTALHVAAAIHGAAQRPMPACGLATASRFVADTADPPAVTNGSLAVPAGSGLGVVPNGEL